MMPFEVIKTRIIKGWGCDFTIQVIRDLDWAGDCEASENHVLTVRLKEIHSGSVPDEHCAEVVISLSEMNYSWKDRRGKNHVKGVFVSHIPLFKSAEDQFIKLLGQHLKREYDYEKFGARNWRIVRWDLKKALSGLVPKKEMKGYNIERDRKSVLRPLKRAKQNAKLFGFSHIVPEIDRLIEEVKLFKPNKEDKEK